MARTNRCASRVQALQEQMKDVITLSAGLLHTVHHLEMELGILEAENQALRDTNEEQARQTINLKHHIEHLETQMANAQKRRRVIQDDM